MTDPIVLHAEIDSMGTFQLLDELEDCSRQLVYGKLTIEQRCDLRERRSYIRHTLDQRIRGNR